MGSTLKPQLHNGLIILGRLRLNLCCLKWLKPNLRLLLIRAMTISLEKIKNLSWRKTDGGYLIGASLHRSWFQNLDPREKIQSTKKKLNP